MSLTRGLSITRDELSLAVLDLNDGTSREIAGQAGVQPGSKTWRRETASSPHVPGSLVVHSVRDRDRMAVQIVHKASTFAAVWTLVEETEAAFDQATFVVAETIGAQQIDYAGSEADASHVWSGLWMEVPAMLVLFEFPHRLITVDGS